MSWLRPQLVMLCCCGMQFWESALITTLLKIQGSECEPDGEGNKAKHQ